MDRPGPSRRIPYFAWASCGAPFAGALLGAIAAPPGTGWRFNVLIGVAIASAPGMLCAVIAITRRERPWWPWVAGLMLNAYPFCWLVLGLLVTSGIMTVHF